MNILSLKATRFIVAAILSSSVFLVSCSRDEDEQVTYPKPVITKTEVGVHNNKIGYAGSDLHLAAEIEAAGKIETVVVEIHKEDGSGWKEEKTYNDFSGQLNAHFHKHIDIPATAALGEYHLHLKVKDQQGNETVFEEHLKIEVNTDSEGPVATVNVAPSANQQFNLGQSIQISGNITDNVNVGGYLVALVRANDTQISNTSVIIMDLKYFQDKTAVAFDSKINVGAEFDNQGTPVKIQGENAWQSGDYYILVRTWDSTGNITETQKYPVKINL